ncbi:VOC family protein [Streptomyces sp. NPDC005438]|uniref:VOC family protein n=1 Tax=Streptomyces sp. NPDC005438 TaxID=3156880 RepID=UPI00339F8F7E
MRIGSVVLNVDNLPRAMDFWTRALHYVPREPPEDGWVVLTPAHGHGPNLSLNLSTSPPPALPHTHLDLYPDPGSDSDQEVRRLLDLGAQRVDWPHHPEDGDFTVLSDPCGNRFCVIDTRH